MKRINLKAVFAAVIVAAMPIAAAAGTVWNETGPLGAGDSLSTAQTVFFTPASPLDRIHGTLTATTNVNSLPVYQVDLYKIVVNDFSMFSARTALPTAFDTALYLFNESGFGVYSNDDNGVDLLSLLASADPNGPSADGVYYLGIAFGGFLANDALVNSLFQPDGSASPGAGALAGWTPGFDAQTESPFTYDILLSGATTVPAPDGVALMLTACVAMALRRRNPRLRAPAVAA